MSLALRISKLARDLDEHINSDKLKQRKEALLQKGHNEQKAEIYSQLLCIRDLDESVLTDEQQKERDDILTAASAKKETKETENKKEEKEEIKNIKEEEQNQLDNSQQNIQEQPENLVPEEVSEEPKKQEEELLVESQLTRVDPEEWAKISKEDQQKALDQGKNIVRHGGFYPEQQTSVPKTKEKAQEISTTQDKNKKGASR